MWRPRGLIAAAQRKYRKTGSSRRNPNGSSIDGALNPK
jgi:hypothetical protein